MPFKASSASLAEEIRLKVLMGSGVDCLKLVSCLTLFIPAAMRVRTLLTDDAAATVINASACTSSSSTNAISVLEDFIRAGRDIMGCALKCRPAIKMCEFTSKYLVKHQMLTIDSTIYVSTSDCFSLP